ncbi:carbonyl reductase family member 4-like [Actinia tenebrosa]|uniref:3-ketoacyl-[acyl-carrier-protein] reductase beta subunit n=1 Tax=Actinia tenebrosa TaxID=6105 RepID=A0A6P8J3N4_ACTTE|nr:carbonyl reductase family member 4-like [Actinia tenebrosa]XP_031574257.1 carbonyl reductase family member 4-like [Actinia tenebrosa]
MNGACRGINKKVCVVFGGSSGIGKAICKELAKRGGKVIAVGRDGKKALETVQLLCHTSQRQNHASFSCDVTNYSSVEATISQIEATAGDINVLVNAAGVNKDGLLLRAKLNDIDNIVSTNLLGSMYSCKAVLKSMIKRRQGSIVNIGSVVGLKGNTGQSIYSASKSGLVGFTTSLAKEVASKGVQVNLVAPGLVESKMTADLINSESDKGASYRSLVPLKRFGKATEIAHGVCFLVQSSYITGQVLVIDGGLQLVL